MKKNGIIRIVIAAAVTALMVLVAVLGMGPDGSGSVGDIKLGLDLEGGVSITYQTVEENPSKQDLDDTAYKLQLRVADFSNEAEVYTEGSNRINVDIPGAKNAEEILKSLGTPGTLSFKDPSGNEIINGDDIVDAQGGAVQNQTTGANDYQVSMTLNDAGSKKFAEASEKLVGKNISIYYDGKVVAALQCSLQSPAARLPLNIWRAWKRREPLLPPSEAARCLWKSRNCIPRWLGRSWGLKQ